eukprot:gene16092-biopygen1615
MLCRTQTRSPARAGAWAPGRCTPQGTPPATRRCPRAGLRSPRLDPPDIPIRAQRRVKSTQIGDGSRVLGTAGCGGVGDGKLLGPLCVPAQCARDGIIQPRGLPECHVGSHVLASDRSQSPSRGRLLARVRRLVADVAGLALLRRVPSA